jgi:hypothetical protein
VPWPDGSLPQSAELERQTGLRAIRGLDSALLIDAQHDGVLWRCQVALDHVGKVLQKYRTTGKFEVFVQMRLQSVVLPSLLNRIFADPFSAGRRACSPVRRAGRLGLERGLKSTARRQPPHSAVCDHARRRSPTRNRCLARALVVVTARRSLDEPRVQSRWSCRTTPAKLQE